MTIIKFDSEFCGNCGYLWEIFVPAQRRPEIHNIWDEKVIAITGGLTLLGKNKGK